MSMGQALAATVTLQMLSGMGVLEYGTTLPRNHPQRFLFVNSRALMDEYWGDEALSSVPSSLSLSSL